jgi:hypothetical protein
LCIYLSIQVLGASVKVRCNNTAHLLARIGTQGQRSILGELLGEWILSHSKV